MSPQEAYYRFAAVLTLPQPQQAECVRLAAEAAASAWQEWCGRRGMAERSGELLGAFERWLGGAATDDELDTAAADFLTDLPQDLRAEPEPAGGYAGWALLGVVQVALGRFPDVHGDILHTARCYAAAAACRTGAGPLTPCWTHLGPAELAFLAGWWAGCCDRRPSLVGAVQTPNQALQRTAGAAQVIVSSSAPQPPPRLSGVVRRGGLRDRHARREAPARPSRP